MHHFAFPAAWRGRCVEGIGSAQPGASCLPAACAGVGSAMHRRTLLTTCAVPISPCWSPFLLLSLSLFSSICKACIGTPKVYAGCGACFTMVQCDVQRDIVVASVQGNECHSFPQSVRHTTGPLPVVFSGNDDGRPHGSFHKGNSFAPP